jgi:hypothetical protein
MFGLDEFFRTQPVLSHLADIQEQKEASSVAVVRFAWSCVGFSGKRRKKKKKEKKILWSVQVLLLVKVYSRDVQCQ